MHCLLESCCPSFKYSKCLCVYHFFIVDWKLIQTCMDDCYWCGIVRKREIAQIALFVSGLLLFFQILLQKPPFHFSATLFKTCMHGFDCSFYTFIRFSVEFFKDDNYYICAVVVWSPYMKWSALRCSCFPFNIRRKLKCADYEFAYVTDQT